MKNSPPLLLLIDGHALAYRSWYGMRNPMTISSTGEDVRTVYSFINSFLRTISQFTPTNCIMVFDTPAPTFRHKEFVEYKSNRPPMPDELRTQFTRIRQVVSAFNIPIFELDGFEADDLIGTLSRQAESNNIHTIILTGDSDLLQLVSPSVKVLMNNTQKQQKIYDIEAVKERYEGLGPDSIIQIKALTGDSSDNIPGVPGIGPKNAIRLVKQFGTINNMLDKITEISPARIQKVVENNQSEALQALRLVTIDCEAPIKIDLETSLFDDFSRNQVLDLFRELEFHSLVSRVPQSKIDNLDSHPSQTPKTAEEKNHNYHIVQDSVSLNNLIENINKTGIFSFDTETDELNPMNANLVGISISTQPGNAWYIPISHNIGDQLSMAEIHEKLNPLFSNPEIDKIAHNSNYDITILEEHGFEVSNVSFDTILAAHLIGKRSLGLKPLVLEYLQKEMTPITDLIGKGVKQITMNQVSIKETSAYACADADYSLQLKNCLEPELEQISSVSIFKDVEMPLAPVLVQMQRNGVSLDPEPLKLMSTQLTEELKTLTEQIFTTAGHEFNINSFQQLGEVLFNELKLPPIKRTSRGYSTDAASLDRLKQMLDLNQIEDVDPKSYQILNDILDYRKLSKLKSTYVDSLPGMINQKTGRIHTIYNQTGSSTGRISSNDPNLQNIPVRTEIGKKVRDAFIAGKSGNSILISADYSQIELRILAHISEDPALINAFLNGADIHASTAASMYGVKLSDVSAEMRRTAKIMNFGVIYGLSPYGIRQQTGFSEKEGKEFINTYFSTYPGIRNYIDSIKENVRQNSFVSTIMGRRRYIYEIESKNYNVRSAAERMAVNMPIQGTAAEIIKIAMVRIQNYLDISNLKSKMIMQVHDELIFETPENEKTEIQNLLYDLMPSSIELKVPLEIEIKSGKTWGSW